MTPDLEAIRARREHLRLSLVRTSEHFEQGAYELRHNAITDIDALLAEVERLNSKRWAYFSAPTYYPSGGMLDCVSRHATEAEATAAMGNDLDGEVVDLFAELPERNTAANE